MEALVDKKHGTPLQMEVQDLGLTRAAATEERAIVKMRFENNATQSSRITKSLLRDQLLRVAAQADRARQMNSNLPEKRGKPRRQDMNEAKARPTGAMASEVERNSAMMY